MTDEATRKYQAGYYLRHKDERAQQYQDDREARLKYAREHRRKERLRFKRAIFEAYGNRCTCCGEDNPGFLSIEHVNGGGRAHRKAVGGTVALYRAIIKAGFPPDYTLLCFNCNLGRQINGGECPHKVGYKFFEGL